MRKNGKTEPAANRSGAGRVVTGPEEATIAALAYDFWIERGSPIGSPEVDWLRAEEELRNQSRPAARAAGA